MRQEGSKDVLGRPSFKRILGQSAALILMMIMVLGTSPYFNRDLSHLEQQWKILAQQVSFLQEQRQLTERFANSEMQQQMTQHVWLQDRVKLTDHLLRLQQSINLIDFWFQFEPQRPLVVQQLRSFVETKTDFKMMRLNLKMGLRSDLDLVRLIQGIAEKFGGLVVLERCHIKIQSSDFEAVIAHPLQADLTALCVFNLIEPHLNPLNKASRKQKINGF